MNHLKVYRLTGVLGLGAIAVCFVEFPLYFIRAPSPRWPFKLGDFAARNATNTMTCLLFDMVLLLVLLAGFRHLIRQSVSAWSTRR